LEEANLILWSDRIGDNGDKEKSSDKFGISWAKQEQEEAGPAEAGGKYGCGQCFCFV
jgi:hypothetical protein